MKTKLPYRMTWYEVLLGIAAAIPLFLAYLRANPWESLCGMLPLILLFLFGWYKNLL